MISVIIPLYNKVDGIGRCINSVLEQTYTDWELLIVDDGSTDNSPEIAKKFLADQRIKYLPKKNGGVSSARNYGIEKAKGEWIICIDADDYFLPSCLELLLNYAKNNDTYIVSGNYYNELEGKRHSFLKKKKAGFVRNNFLSALFHEVDLRAGATIFKAILLKRYRYDETLCRYEDAKYNSAILRDNRMFFTPDFVMVHTLDHPGLSQKSDDISKDYISCMEFENKSFWEKVLLGNLLASGISLYTDNAEWLKEKYKGYLKWMYIGKFFRIYIKIMNLPYKIVRKCQETLH